MATLQQIISSLPVGKTNAMKVSAFEEAIGNQPKGTNNDQTRGEVTDAIVNNEIPIGSSPQCGYWLIDSDAECQEIVDRLDAIIRAYAIKRTAIVNGWTRRKQSKASGRPWPK